MEESLPCYIFLHAHSLDNRIHLCRDGQQNMENICTVRLEKHCPHSSFHDALARYSLETYIQDGLRHYGRIHKVSPY